MRTTKAGRNFNLATQPKVPTKVRCKVKGEWKPIGMFSKAQQRKMDSRDFDPVHSGMVCLEHSPAAGREEFTCEGKCGLRKTIDHFSRSQRRNGNYICVRCVAWDETQEPDVTPGPLETGNVSAEERPDYVAWNQPHGDDWSLFGTNPQPLAPITNMETLTLEDSSEGTEFISDAASSVADTDTSSQSLPHHLAGLGAPSTVSETASMNSEARNRNGEGRIPPHLRRRDESTSSTGDSRNGEGWIPPHLRGPRSISTATTTREDRLETKKSRQVDFNAWDDTGAQHVAVKSPTISSNASSSTASVADGVENVTEGQRRASQAMSTKKSRGNWAKVETLKRTELRTSNVPERGDIDPESDRNKRLNNKSSGRRDW